MAAKFFLLFVLGSVRGFAGLENPLYPPPRNQCFQQSCSPQQEAIWAKFESGRDLPLLVSANLHSGVCYHRAHGYDPGHTHYGAVLLVPRPEGEYFYGTFIFFAQSNPWENWTAEDALKDFGPSYQPTHLLHREAGYAWVDQNPKGPMWRYYLRSNQHKLIVMGFWGTGHTLFCELNAH